MLPMPSPIILSVGPVGPIGPIGPIFPVGPVGQLLQEVLQQKLYLLLQAIFYNNKIFYYTIFIFN
jgi:hypothetical protein